MTSFSFAATSVTNKQVLLHVLASKGLKDLISQNPKDLGKTDFRSVLVEREITDRKTAFNVSLEYESWEPDQPQINCSFVATVNLPARKPSVNPSQLSEPVFFDLSCSE